MIGFEIEIKLEYLDVDESRVLHWHNVKLIK
jgi:hypothetical protein